VSKEIEEQMDHTVPRAADKAAAFLGVIQETCRNEGLDLALQPVQRSRRDQSIVLRAPIHAGRGNVLELEVFADPMGSGLHVGWQATRETLGGDTFGSFGMLGEMNARRRKNAGKADNQRMLTGLLRSFNDLVYGPVVQQLSEAVAASQPRANGFLGA
jgi:hypothetical protein